MFTRRLRELVAAASFALMLAFACQSLVNARPYAQTAPAAPGRCASSASGAASNTRRASILRGRSVARFGGYELNVAFTPEGELLGFDISPVAPTREATRPRA